MLSCLVLHFWNACRNRGERSRRPAKTAVIERSVQDAVSLGTIVRSPHQYARNGDTLPSELWLTTLERRKHQYILGATGCGKTTLLLKLIQSDIACRRGVFLLDARGELVDRVLMHLAHTAPAEEWAGRLLLIDLRRTDYSVPFNPLAPQGSDPYTRVKFVLEMLKQEWALGVQTEQLLRNSLHALSTAHTLNEVEPLLVSLHFRRQVLETVTDLNVRRFFARFDALENPSSWVEPVLNKISPWLSRPELRQMLCQSESVSFTKLLDKRSDPIVLVALSADTLFSDAMMIGRLLTSALASAAMRAERRDRPGNEVTFYLDEFENFTQMGEQFAAMLAEGRKFGLGLCLSHQTSIQLDPKLRVLIRNIVGTQLFFGVGGSDSDILAGEIASDEPKAVLRNLIMNQGVGEALVVRRGQPFARIKTHPLSDPKVSEEAVEALRLMALRHYGTSREAIEVDLQAREVRSTASTPLSAPLGEGGTSAPWEVRDYDPDTPKPRTRRKKPSA